MSLSLPSRIVRIRSQRGFSLIELSVVLVIVGLLLGGILKGTELIAQARGRSTTNAFENITQAFFSYQERYRALPGDDYLAQGRWPSTATSGNGDRVICGAYHGGSGGASCSGSTESALVWQHLHSAGLLNGAGSTPPDHPANGQFGIQYGGFGLSRHLLCANNLPASIAGSIDRQLDDGLANQGEIRAVLQSGTADIPTTTPSSTAYVEEGNPLYVLCRAL